MRYRIAMVLQLAQTLINAEYKSIDERIVKLTMKS